MNNAEYWARRFKIMEDSIKDQAYDYAVNLEEQFDRAIAQIDTQMRAWYQRFADNNSISWAEAQRLLTTDELKEFRWTVQEYIKYGKEHAITGAWAKELENASARVHISRLDSLKVQLRQQAEALTEARIKATTDASVLSYTESYYHTAYEVQRGLGVGWTMQAINRGEVEKLLSRPWTVDNQTFRARCWTDKTKLVETVNQELTRMIATGEAPDKAIAAIAKRFNVSKQNAGRVVMTESAYFSSAAQKDCFNDLGVEQYKVVATLDSSTCETCGDFDSKVFKMSEYQVGATAPPFHPWCRCCTAPYFEDMEGMGERYSRDPVTGERKMVPGNMTYKEWAKQFVVDETKINQNQQNPLTTPANGGTMVKGVGAPIHSGDAVSDFTSLVHSSNGMTQDYEDALTTRFKAGKPDAQAAFAKYVSPGSVVDGAYGHTPHYNPATQGIKMSYSADFTNPRGAGTTFFHEHGHYIDHLSQAVGQLSTSTPAFAKAIKSDFAALVKSVQAANNCTKTEAYAKLSALVCSHETHSISDIFGGLSRNQARGYYGHKASYWTGDAVPVEAFAHLFEAQFDAKKYALWQQYFPTAVAEFEKLLKGVV